MKERDAAHFLQQLAPAASNLLEIRTIVPDGGPVRSVFVRSVDDAIAAARRADGRANVYVGACPRSKPRGSREAVQLVTTVWADIDFHDVWPGNPEHAIRLAMSKIEEFAIRPTMLVHTGNGLHTWWLFTEPQALTDEWPAERFEA